MSDLAMDLKQGFEWAMDVCLEAYEVLPDGRSFERSDVDERAIKIFERLGNTVEEIPPALIASAEALRADEPDLFERLLEQRFGAVGSDFSPASATEFLNEVLAKR